MASPANPLRDLGIGLLLLGGIVLVFAVGLTVAQALLLEAGPRTYGFGSLAPLGIAIGGLLVVVGAAFRLLAVPRDRARDFR